MLKSRLLLLAVLALPPALPAAAQPASPPVAADAEARDAARALIEATGMTAMMGQVLDGMRAPLAQILRQRAPQVAPAEVERTVEEVLMPEFRARLPEFADAAVAIYVQNFTAAEMREMVALYATPLGRKMLQVMPQVAQQSIAFGQAWGQRVAEDALSKNRAVLRGRGINL